MLYWLTSHFSSRGKALSLYRRGMRKAKQHNHQGAIEDYTATIGMSDVPSDIKAMARFNRALVHVATANTDKGIDDLNSVLVMQGASEEVKAMARQKLVRIKSRLRKSDV